MDDEGLSAVLVDFAHTSALGLSLQRTLDHFVAGVAEVLPVTGAGALLLDAEEAGPHFLAASDQDVRRIEGLQLELGEGPCVRAYRTGRCVLVPDLSADDTFPRFSPRAVRAGFGAAFAFPLRVGAEQIGALQVYTAKSAMLSAQDRSAAQTLADAMADYLSRALGRHAAEQAELVLQEQALHDPLTELPTHLILQDRLQQALRNTRRSRGLVGVLRCHLDGLKDANDMYGEKVGDQFLSHVARRIEAVLRPDDTLARLSEDEFVVVCGNLSRQRQGEQVAERILGSVAVPLEGAGLSLLATVSIGIAFAREGARSAEGALQQAGEAMRDANSRGGARWVASPAPARPVRAA